MDDKEITYVCKKCGVIIIDLIICEKCEWERYCSEKCKLEDSGHNIKCKTFALLGGHEEKEFQKYKIEHFPLNNNRFTCVATCDIKEGECILREKHIAAISSSPFISNELLGRSSNVYRRESPELVEIDLSIKDVQKIGEVIKAKLASAMSILYPWIGESQVFPTRLVGTKNECELITGINIHLEKMGTKQELWKTSFLYGAVSYGAFNITKEFEHGWAFVGFFPRSSLFNHSCLPNIDFTFCTYDQKLAFFACRDIKKGEELTFDFTEGMLDFIPSEERKQNVMDIYGIPCNCGFCSKKEIEIEDYIDDSFPPILNPGSGADILVSQWVKNPDFFEKRPKMLMHLASEMISSSTSSLITKGIKTFVLVLKQANVVLMGRKGCYRKKDKMILGLYLTLIRQLMFQLKDEKGSIEGKIVIDYIKSLDKETIKTFIFACGKIQKSQLLIEKLSKASKEAEGMTSNLSKIFSLIILNKDEISKLI